MTLPGVLSPTILVEQEALLVTRPASVVRAGLLFLLLRGVISGSLVGPGVLSGTAEANPAEPLMAAAAALTSSAALSPSMYICCEEGTAESVWQDRCTGGHRAD